MSILDLEPESGASELADSWLDALTHVDGRVALALVAFLLFALLVQSLRLAWSRGAAARRLQRHKDLGEAGERRARKLLERSGYRITGVQAPGQYELLVDGVSQKIHLRADFLVERGGHTYVAEVKSGEESGKITGRATRRQLLEYQVAFAVSGVLLVDSFSDTIREVVFPKSLPLSRARTTR